MAKGSSIREKKHQHLDRTFQKISLIYLNGLYGFIESRPTYNEELEKLEQKIQYICSSDMKSIEELKKELVKFYGIHERALKAYRLVNENK